MKLILYSTFLFLLAPCNASKKTTASAQQPAADNKLRTVEITFEKTVCFGKCPAFTMTISGEKNKITYKGTSGVDKIGTYEKNISDDQLTKLVDAFDKSKFFEMQDEYTSQIMDVPSRYVGYTISGKTKKIKDRYKAPAELTALEKMLDEIADTDDWHKVE